MEAILRSPISFPRLPKLRLLYTLQSLIAVIVLFTVTSITTGCTPSQKMTTLQVVTAINNYTPAIVSGADTVAATLSFLLPTESALIGVADTAFHTLATTVQTLTASYLANPNASTLQQLQTAVNNLEASINAASLASVKITNPASQQMALAAIKGLLTVVTIVFGLIQQTETHAQLRDLASTKTIQLALTRRFMDEKQLQDAAVAQGVPRNYAAQAVDRSFDLAAEAGL